MVLLDSEGIDSVNSEGYDDNQIFTLTVLLASVLIYNSQGVPARRDLEGLKYPLNYFFHSSNSFSLHWAETKSCAMIFQLTLKGNNSIVTRSETSFTSFLAISLNSLRASRCDQTQKLKLENRRMTQSLSMKHFLSSYGCYETSLMTYHQIVTASKTTS